MNVSIPFFKMAKYIIVTGVRLNAVVSATEELLEIKRIILSGGFEYGKHFERTERQAVWR
jgi:hypothetical protein